MNLSVAGKPFWLFVADCGDIAVILPAYLAVAAVLALHRRHREAIVWGLGLLACAAIAGLLKVEIGAFELTLFGHTFHAASFPSGHSSLSLAFYGGLAVLVGYRAPARLGRIAAALLLVFVALIAVAVWMLWWHPSMDIVCGLALGALCIAPLAAMPRRRSSREVAAMLAAAVLLVAALHGTRFDERALEGLSMRQVALPRG
jgi:undecaprenyl-diphosphatase